MAIIFFPNIIIATGGSELKYMKFWQLLTAIHSYKVS
jgi:hypothetical protein